MISCYQATQLISKQLDHPLSLREKAHLVLHLLNCWRCKLFESQMLIIGNSIKELANETVAFKRLRDIGLPGLSPEAKTRILLAIRNKR